MSAIARTPLVLRTPEGIQVMVRGAGPGQIEVAVAAGTGQMLGDGTYALTPTPTDIQMAMPAVVRDGVVYDALWVGCASSGTIAPTNDRRESQARGLEKYVDDLAAQSSWHKAVDAAAVKAAARATITNGNGSDETFIGAAWRVLNSYPQGHQSIFSADPAVCAKIGQGNSSRFGVCGRPTKGGIVVTVARPGNKLGLAVGDVVVAADNDSGDAMVAHTYDRPMCGGVYPAKSGRREAGAASFFGVIPAHTKLSVRSVDGRTRSVEVPAQSDPQPISCADPFGRDVSKAAYATRRPDGIAVIRLPSFFPQGQPLPTTQEGFERMRDEFQAELVRVFDTVKDAPAIIWDTRGNGGGITPVALAIVSGFPSARATRLSACRSRIPGSNPPAFVEEKTNVYEITPGGPFAYTGKVAVVTDGVAYSAGDYFAFAARTASDAIVVGSATGGAFGGARSNFQVAGPPALEAAIDTTACFDERTNRPLEGAPPEPTISIELSAKDVAAGRDTVLERAAQALLR